MLKAKDRGTGERILSWWVLATKLSFASELVRLVQCARRFKYIGRSLKHLISPPVIGTRLSTRLRRTGNASFSTEDVLDVPACLCACVKLACGRFTTLQLQLVPAVGDFPNLICSGPASILNSYRRSLLGRSIVRLRAGAASQLEAHSIRPL